MQLSADSELPSFTKEYQRLSILYGIKMYLDNHFKQVNTLYL